MKSTVGASDFEVYVSETVCEIEDLVPGTVLSTYVATCRIAAFRYTFVR